MRHCCSETFRTMPLILSAIGISLDCVDRADTESIEASSSMYCILQQSLVTLHPNYREIHKDNAVGKVVDANMAILPGLYRPVLVNVVKPRKLLGKVPRRVHDLKRDFASCS